MFAAGVEGAVTVEVGSNTDGALLGGWIDGLDKNLKTKFSVLLGHF